MNARFHLSVALVLSSLAFASCGDGDSAGESSGSCNPACDAATEICENGECVKLCGNGVLDAAEECDTVDGEVQFASGANKTCSDLDMDGGDLKCDSSCKVDSSECTAKPTGPIDPDPQAECASGAKKCDAERI